MFCSIDSLLSIADNNRAYWSCSVYDGQNTLALPYAENGGYPPTQNGDIRSLFWLFSLMALQN